MGVFPGPEGSHLQYPPISPYENDGDVHVGVKYTPNTDATTNTPQNNTPPRHPF